MSLRQQKSLPAAFQLLYHYLIGSESQYIRGSSFRANFVGAV
jgi:hypothetical protein